MFSPKPFVAMVAFAAVNHAAFADIEVNPIPDHPDWGYTVTEFPEAPDDIAIVFTNHNPESSMFWKMPHGADNVQFLVVGGGGGGGCGSQGAGGGGGGVVTGVVKRLSKSVNVFANVGAGGKAFTATSGGDRNGQAGYTGDDSSIVVSENTYVIAYGGGAGGGNNTSGDARCRNGGSGAGAKTSNPVGVATMGWIDDGYVSGVPMGNNGGTGVTYASGGGGGACGVGGNATLSNPYRQGGDGGPGLISEITGESLDYGSGGGGGGTGNVSLAGGSGAGAGSKDDTAGSALNNRGGGGGDGGSWAVQGGNGGSGIVVIRYRQKPPVFKIIVR